MCVLVCIAPSQCAFISLVYARSCRPLLLPGCMGVERLSFSWFRPWSLRCLQPAAIRSTTATVAIPCLPCHTLTHTVKRGTCLCMVALVVPLLCLRGGLLAQQWPHAGWHMHACGAEEVLCRGSNSATACVLFNTPATLYICISPTCGPSHEPRHTFSNMPCSTLKSLMMRMGIYAWPLPCSAHVFGPTNPARPPVTPSTTHPC